MNAIYQKLFVGIIALLSIVLLVFSIRNHVTISIVFSSFVIFFSVLYILTTVKLNGLKATVNTPHLNSQWTKNIIQKKDLFKTYIKYGFLASLFLIALGSLKFALIQSTPLLKDIVPWLASNSTLFTIFAVILGGATFWISRKDIEQDTEQELAQEELVEQQRTTEFPEKYPTINKIPVLRDIIKLINNEGVVFLMLILIIFGFSLIRAGSFDIPWEHTANYDKIRSEIPGAINAHLNNDFFHEENNFYGNVDGYGLRNYSSLPLHQWTIAPLMNLTDSISIFTIVKSLMLFIDVIILFSLFFLLKNILKNKLLALVGILYIATNIFYQINFATPVTDRFAFLFFVLGANLLIRKKHFASYLFGGMSILAKESFFFITIPFYLILELFSLKKNPENTINRLIVNIPVMLTPYLLFQTFIKNLPTASTHMRVIYIFITIMVLCVLYVLNNKKFNFYQIRRKYKIIGLIGLVGIFLTSLYFITSISNQLSINFLTDKEIIFNWEMYKILLQQFADFFGNFIWVFIILGLATIFIFDKWNKYLLAIFTAASIYLIFVSKAIVFHQYYRHIFMLLFVIFILLVYKQIYKIFINKTKVKILLLFIIIITTYSNYQITSIQLNKTEAKKNTIGLEEAGVYLRNNLDEKINILYNDYKIYAITIFSSFHNPCQLDKRTIRPLVREKGLQEILKKYNCTYYASIGESDFKSFLDYFVETSHKNELSRTDLILLRTSKKITDKYNYQQTFDMRTEFIETNYLINPQEAYLQFNPKQYFKLEKIIGDIYIYKLK